MALCLASMLPVFAQEAPSAVLAPADVQALRARVEVSPTLDPAAKSGALDQCAQAFEQLRLAEEWKAKAAQFRQDTVGAEDLTLDLQEKLLKPLESPESMLPDGVTAVQVAQLVAQTQADLDAIRMRITELDAETVTRGTSRIQLPAAITAAELRLADLTAQVSAPVPEGSVGEAEEARKALLQASFQLASAELDSYGAEMENYDIRSGFGLPQLLRDDANREASRLDEMLAMLQQEAVVRRADEAQEAEIDARKAQAEIEGAHPFVRGFAEKVAASALDFATRRTGAEGLTVKLEVAQREETRLEESLRELEENVTNIQNRVTVLGLNDAVGVLLRKERASVPSVRGATQDLRSRQEEIGNALKESIDLADQRAALADIDRLIDRETLGLAAQAEERELDRNKDLLRRLLLNQRTNLDALYRDYDDYGRALLDLNETQGQIIAKARAFQEYIDERVLWIRSGETFGWTNIAGARAPLLGLFDPVSWIDTGGAIWSHTLQFPTVNAVLVILYACMLLATRWLRRELGLANERAAKPACVTYRDTIRAFLITVLLAGIFAGLLAAVSWRAASSLDPTNFGRGAASGLLVAATVMFSIELIRKMARPMGLAEVHFDWTPGPMTALRRHLLWFSFVCLPAVYLIAVVEWHGDESWRDSLGRCIFLLLMATLAALTFVLLRAKGAVTALLGESEIRGSGFLLRWGRLPLMLLPAAFFIQAFAGYYYTSVHLSWRMYVTFCLALGLIIARGMIVRWLLVTRRRLTIEHMRLRREARKAREAADADTAAPIEEPVVNLRAISDQSNSLLGSALMLAFLVGNWLIWKSVLPALGALDNIAISTYLVDDVKEVISLADCILAAIIALMTWAAARNLPAIIEIVLLQRFKVAAGERYAISAITRYTITVIGVAAVANALGIGWDKVQWLVAALSLGLGFGLQEIFANFVSGLIILFERPVRVGDAVTIGNVSGVVSKIRIRATTIVDWDRKELIVPNKEFVTGQVLNWSLSDSISRLVVPVGIAYGSDTTKAMELMYSIAKEHPQVLEDPAPKVWFIGFGASSLDLELHVYSPNIDANMPIQHDMHIAIDRAFREAKIEIAFPQRDLHIRSVDPSVPMFLPEMDVPRDLS